MYDSWVLPLPKVIAGPGWDNRRGVFWVRRSCNSRPAAKTGVPNARARDEINVPIALSAFRDKNARAFPVSAAGDSTESASYSATAGRIQLAYSVKLNSVAL